MGIKAKGAKFFLHEISFTGIVMALVEILDIARNGVKPAITNLQKKPILNFPRGSQRTSTVVTGSFILGSQNVYSNPNDYSDLNIVLLHLKCCRICQQ